MSVARMQFFSEALGKWTTYNVLLPDVGEGPYPVVMQLHGLSDDCDAWLQRSNIVRHAAEYPMAIIFPDGGTHCYVNWQGSERVGKANYEDLVVNDIPSHMRRHFNVTEGPWAIGGLSMGGWGALHLGMAHSEMFASIWAHSSKIDWATTGWNLSLLEDPATLDLRAQIDRAREVGHLPTLSFDCGVDDELIEESRALHEWLDDRGIDHHYAEHPGGHEWDYWDRHVREALEQHARVLGVEKVRPA